MFVISTDKPTALIGKKAPKVDPDGYDDDIHHSNDGSLECDHNIQVYI